MNQGIFLSEQHKLSRRWAVLEDDGAAAWLYLTEPGATKPIADCWLYNSVPAPAERNFGRGDTPVVPLTHTAYAPAFASPSPEAVGFKWAPDGHSIAVFFSDQLMGFIANLGPHGHSRLLNSSGPYGSPLDEALYASTFQEA